LVTLLPWARLKDSGRPRRTTHSTQCGDVIETVPSPAGGEVVDEGVAELAPMTYLLSTRDWMPARLRVRQGTAFFLALSSRLLLNARVLGRRQALEAVHDGVGERGQGAVEGLGVLDEILGQARHAVRVVDHAA
jgi:hypothetical protein